MPKVQEAVSILQDTQQKATWKSLALEYPKWLDGLGGSVVKPLTEALDVALSGLVQECEASKEDNEHLQLTLDFCCALQAVMPTNEKLHSVEVALTNIRKAAGVEARKKQGKEVLEAFTKDRWA